MNKRFCAGTAKVDITPPLTIPYLGYEPRHALFHGVHDPLYARALAFDDGETQSIVIAADSIGFSNQVLGPGRNFTGVMRQRIQQRCGVPSANIMLASSHAHSTPETANLRSLLETTPAAASWLDVLMDQLASAAVMALVQRKPSRLKVGAGQVYGLSRNRRVLGKDGRILPIQQRDQKSKDTTSGPTDPQVGILYLETIEDDRCTIVSNFACHPVTVQVQPLVSADFPGAAMTLVERAVRNCENSLFLQGACADQNPARNTSGFADVERYGQMLGGEIVKLVGQLSARDYMESPTRIAVASETIPLQVRDLPSRASIQQAYDGATQRLAAAVTETEKQTFAREQRMAKETLILVDRGSEPIPAEVQVIRIGDVALVALPGEPFVELGLTLKERSVAPHTMVVGYANDWIGYLTTPRAWDEGGYEVSPGPWTRVGRDGGFQLVDKALELVNELWR